MRSILLCIILLLTGYYLIAQIPSVPNGNMWVTNQIVKTITVDGDYTYIGGSFNYVGPNTGYSALLTTASPAPNSSFPKVNDQVNCIIPDGSGGWFMGGKFTKAGTDIGHNLVHITSAGVIDNSWNVSTDISDDGEVSGMKIYDNFLYITGIFTQVNDITGFLCLARINITTGNVDAEWVPTTEGLITSMAVNSTGQLYITGLNFTEESISIFLKKIDGITGAVDGTWLPEAPDGMIMSIAVNSSDEVFIGGDFKSIGSTSITNLAKLSPVDGSLVSGWAPNPDGEVTVIVPNGEDLYIGGDFSYIDGKLIPHLARVDRTVGLADDGWVPSPGGSGSVSINTVAFDGEGNVYAGGNFYSMGGTARNFIAKVSSTDGSLDESWVSHASNLVKTIAVNGSTIYMGGSFNSFGGQPRRGIAKLENSTGALVPEWKADLNDGYAYVFSIVVNGGYVYVGGDYSSIGGNSIPYLSRVDINTGNVDAAWSPDADHPVLAMLKDETNIYVGGNFENIFTSSAKKYFVKLDATGNPVADWSPAPDAPVSALALDGNNLYTAGSFNNIDAQSRRYLAKLNKTTGHLISEWIPTNDAEVSEMVVSGNYVYLAGGFSKINEDLSFSRLGRVDKTDGTLDEAWHPAPDGYVYTVAVDGSDIYIGGDYSNIDGQPIKYFAKVNSTNGSADPSWDHNLDAAVHSLVTAGNTLLVGGAFQTFHNESITSFAAFTSSGALPVELTSFTASVIDNKVTLNWSTATEVNNYGFQVQRNNNKVESEWEVIGFVEGSGNSNSPKQYIFADANPLSGNLHYRLKQIDTDGSFNYYNEIAEVIYSLTGVEEKQFPTEFGLSQNYPNPFNPVTVISYQLPASLNPSKGGTLIPVTLRVYDLLGKEVATLVDKQQQPGYYNVKFDGSNLSTGIYIYKLTAGNFTSTKKLIMIK